MDPGRPSSLFAQKDNPLTDTTTKTEFTIEQAAKAAKVFNDLYRRPTSNLAHAKWLHERYDDWEALSVFINAQRETIAYDYCKKDSKGAPLRVQGNLQWSSPLNIEKAEKAIDKVFKTEMVPENLVPTDRIPYLLLSSFEISPAEWGFIEPFVDRGEPVAVVRAEML